MNMYVHGEQGTSFMGPEIYDLHSWQNMRRHKVILPSDGCGFWIIAGKVSEVSCFDPQPENATGVEWHNR